VENGKNMMDFGALGCLATAFGIPFGLQGKPLPAVQLASLCFFFINNIKALSPRHWPSMAEA
jgi:hypothetical protein